MIDIGVNLTNQRFDKDCREVLLRARQAGVHQCLVTGTNLAESVRAVALVKEFQGEFPGMLFSTAGIHPHDAIHCDADALAGLATLITDNPGIVVAVGETGLDFNRDLSPRQSQEHALQQQIELAIRSGLPLFLHERDAADRQLALLKEFGQALPPAVIHCFTGSRAALDAYLEMGLWIGITGWVCDERRGIELQSLVKSIPSDKLLVETDAPYLLPRTLKPKPKSNRNEPAFLPLVIEMIASCRDQPPEEIATATTANARRFFRL